MTRLELAVRTYERLSRTGRDELYPSPGLGVWFSEDVAPVLEELASTRRFRDLALWPLITLKPGSGTPEREAIDEVDRSLISCAQIFMRHCNQKQILGKLKERFPPQPFVASETIEISAGRSRSLDRQLGMIDEFEMDLQQLCRLCDRPWNDLVEANDYFEPQPEYTWSEQEPPVQHASTVVSLNPDLLTVGNFLVRRLLARIREEASLLQRVRLRLLAILSSQSKKDIEIRTVMNTEWKRLESARNQLEPYFRPGGEIMLIDSFVACTQLYAAIHPQPDLSWLEIDEQVVASGAAGLKYRIRGLHSWETLDRIAAHLTTLRALNPGERNELDPIEAAVAAGGLVLNGSAKKAFWKKKSLALATLQFDCLWLLARGARSHCAANLNQLYEIREAVTESAISSLVNRLRASLPSELRRAIKGIRGQPGYYRFHLERDQIQCIGGAHRQKVSQT